ncbi:hypothetical protein [uncultured Paludibaculum sp.]|uniref:hypothetical protein n=1 Tax=uncultured Paludibaculum sp. TaxID=1765020 RepID=UPI002AAC31B4|nr:hypothetical protein [uncultured Paludibaculum sp.]
MGERGPFARSTRSGGHGFGCFFFDCFFDVGGLRGESGQTAFDPIDTTGDPAVVGQEPFGGGGLLSEPEGCLVGAAIGLGAGGVEEGAFEGVPAEFVGLQHAAVDEEQAGSVVGTGGGAAEGVVQTLVGEMWLQLERERAGKGFAGVLGGGSFAGFGAGPGGLPGVGAIGGQAAGRERAPGSIGAFGRLVVVAGDSGSDHCLGCIVLPHKLAS